jgi:hypothetical protein
MLRDQWWTPKALLDAAHAIRRAVPDYEFFGSSAYQPVRESINAAEFATRRPWNRDWEVRPVPQSEHFPDVQLRCGDDVRSFEIAEADRTDRRRGLEYWLKQNKRDRLTHYDPGEEARIALVEIGRVLKQKANKRYRPKPHILVYVNLSGASGCEPTTLYADGLAQLYGDCFESAWLLWQENTFRLWPRPAKIRLLASPPAATAN